MYHITYCSFLRFTTFGTTDQNLVFVTTKQFFTSASFEANFLIPIQFRMCQNFQNGGTMNITLDTAQR